MGDWVMVGLGGLEDEELGDWGIRNSFIGTERISKRVIFFKNVRRIHSPLDFCLIRKMESLCLYLVWNGFWTNNF